MKRLIVIFAAMSALVSLSLGMGAAQAGAVHKTTGSIELAGPVQYVSFEAFQSTPVKGNVRYTNFEYAVPGTGVWVPTDFAMDFGGATYAMSVTSFEPMSPTSVKFAGTGDSGVGWISTFTGMLEGDQFHLWMTEINASDPTETYALTAHGTITSDGSVAGTWQDNYGSGRTGTFSIASIGHEVFSYVAPVTSVSVSDSAADFTFTIPSGLPFAGTVVYVHVTDGGSPGAGHDTWSHGTSPGSLSSYTIVGGNLTVF